MGAVLSIAVAVVVAAVLLRIGVALLRGMGRPLPEPPPAGELRRVKLRYRCPQCGMEIRVTTSPLEDPIPPRHCMDEMDLVASGDD